MSGIPWKTELQRALSATASDPNSRYFAVSTPGPHVRFMGFRGFVNEQSQDPKTRAGEVVITTTDVRSEKVKQIRSGFGEQEEIEVAWWISGTQEQFRLTARPILIRPPPHPYPRLSYLPDPEQLRHKVFESLFPTLRAELARPVAPGTPVPQGVDAYADPAVRGADDPQALDHFAVVLLEVNAVDWLRLGEKPERRIKFVRKAEEAVWEGTEVVP